MSPRAKIATGSLLGAVAIHLAFIACSAGRGMVGMDGGTGSETAVIDVVSDAARDMLAMETGDVQAQSCATCSTSGAVHMMTADTDPAQLVGGHANVTSAPVMLAAGPLVLTDYESTSAFDNLVPVNFGVVAGTSCSALTPDSYGPTLYTAGTLSSGNVTTLGTSAHGGRYFVPAGSVLCSQGAPGGLSVPIIWAGFRPYAM